MSSTPKALYAFVPRSMALFTARLMTPQIPPFTMLSTKYPIDPKASPNSLEAFLRMSSCFLHVRLNQLRPCRPASGRCRNKNPQFVVVSVPLPCYNCLMLFNMETRFDDDNAQSWVVNIKTSSDTPRVPLSVWFVRFIIVMFFLALVYFLLIVLCDGDLDCGPNPLPWTPRIHSASHRVP